MTGILQAKFLGAVWIVVSVGAAIGSAVGQPAPTAPVSVPQYGIFEQSFAWNSAAYTNPWEQVHLTMTLSSPTGRQVTIGGFYYAPNVWKARFAPNQTGNWSWQAVLTDGAKTTRSSGRFSVVKSDWPGFVRQNPQNQFRWVFDNGSPFYPIGVGECLTKSLDEWGLDGGFRPLASGHHERGRVVDMDTYWKAYSEAGINLFRWSVDNCAFGLYHTIDPGGNVYLEEEGRAGDTLVQKLRQYRVRTYTWSSWLQTALSPASDPGAIGCHQALCKVRGGSLRSLCGLLGVDERDHRG